MSFLKGLLNKLLGNNNNITVTAMQNTDSASKQSLARSSGNNQLEKEPEPMLSYKDAVSYAHIKREFGEGFLFSSEPMKVSEQEIDVFTSGARQDIEEKYCGASIAIFESTVYRRIVRLSLSIPTFDSGDRQFDSWHDLFLLEEHNGIIRAVYCTGGYSIAHVEGYAQVYQYPESLKKYFHTLIPGSNSTP